MKLLFKVIKGFLIVWISSMSVYPGVGCGGCTLSSEAQILLSPKKKWKNNIYALGHVPSCFKCVVCISMTSIWKTN